MNECRLLKPPHFYSCKKLNLLISAKFLWVFLNGSVGKESTCNAGDEGDANYMDRGAQWATVHKVTKSQIGPSD